MRQAFTMVELIFVIVILGVLAAIAIPRLNATRDDAKVSAMAQKIAIGATEIAAYATANGSISSDFSQMSNSFLVLKNNSDAVLSPNEATIKMGMVDNCVIVDINSTATTDTLNVTFSPHNNDFLCMPLQQMFHIQDYPMKLRGNSIVY
ncbi:prepilin-type N-terminal cleavage/methylation domain-containing protein [Sulfuricurvum sp.]|uniref:prepilin-type N-terminal cleavage/methylation domain-containing protein n=1 Tax=Sulfuricurvum sp. TaxID=2025608 RepID=UPI00260DF2CB|nr:prepilin-type N-terminal cleavage/methylation domain-containing protein [Sulfuricurvum sp.]MDD2780601.1 prepilin-type N-terminal cleavage/methylation domain-containing protein [Sulfuricurvum sp.]